MEKLKRQHFQGIIGVIALSAVAIALQHFIGVLGQIVWALVIGFVVGNTSKTPASLKPGIKYSEKTILAYAIILMGLPTGASFRSGVPWSAAMIVLTVIIITIFAGLTLHKVFKIDREAGILIGIGNAVCGASAIAAVSSIIKADPKNTGTSIAVINLLGIIGLAVLPPILLASETPILEASLYTGGTMQALGQAVAAGKAIGPETGMWATTIKLFRVSMLLPIALIVAFSLNKTADEPVKLSLIPNFLWLFIVVTVIGYFDLIPESVAGNIKVVEKTLLTLAMLAIGWQIRISSLKTEGPRSMLFGTVIFMIQLATMFILIKTFSPSFG